MNTSKQPALDLTALERTGNAHEQRLAAERKASEQRTAQRTQREQAAWNFLPLLTKLAQDCGVDPGKFAKPLVAAFFAVCRVMREQHLAAELDSLDEDRMVEHYRDGRPLEFALQGYRAALKALRQGIRGDTSPSFRKQLEASVGTPGLRCLWSMLYPLIEGLLTEQGRLYRKNEAPTNRPSVSKKRLASGCYHRDHAWLRWYEQGIKPKAILRQWNTECRQHGGQRLKDDRPANVATSLDVIKAGIRKAKAERSLGLAPS
jgi:hypothetical protein